MEVLRSLQSPRLTGVPYTLTQSRLREKPFASGQALKIPNRKRCPPATKLKLLGFRARSSGSTKFSAEAVEATQKDANLKDGNLVFVAGATGKVGSRTVRELLKLGFKVRAGVRSPQRAESLLQSVEQMKLGVEVASEGSTPTERLEIVECDLEKQNQIGPALGNASVVICCIGASEKEVFDITGPYRIDYQATKNLIDAATAAKVNHFILLTSLGTNKIGFPAAILNLFWGVLIWKRKAEEALLASGLPYTIVRPGGMERPTDAYKETHNVTLSMEDTLFGGQVSNLQVAELIAFMAKNRSLSYCKVVEVIAETTAPLTPMGELLLKIPSQRAEVKPLTESDTADRPQSSVSKTVISEPLTTPVEKETARAKAMATMPLSPYIAYEDLKPPTSPTPTPSTSAGDTRAINGEVIPATLKSDVSSVQINVSEPANSATEKVAVMAVMKKSPLSPYTRYDDLRPPTSPSPNAPTGSLLPPSSSNGGS
ncbi:Protein TIC 62, chloroplastic [Sarracenia purpurea var. burkii]